jgi:Acetyltransferase (GNAT) domain
MFRLLDAVADADEWERLAPTDPHFSPAYYRAFGRGHLATIEYDSFRMVQPFRFQEPGWIGNAYNYGGPVGDYVSTFKFQIEFDDWKNKQGLNERCTACPFVKTEMLSRHLTARDVVLVDLTAIKIRQTTRHCIEKAEKYGARTVMVDDNQNIAMFENMYQASMRQKGAKLHWHYKDGTFAKVLGGLGPKRSALFMTTLGGTVQSGCIVIFDEKVCYYHWAATYGLRPNDGANHFQIWSVINWAKEQGLSYVHLGGGLEPNDGLFKFKSGFSPITRKVFSYTTIVGS